MKVCVTASEKSLEAPLDPRFGRCRYFLIVDAETLKFEAIDNVAAGALHGAGIQAAQTVVDKGVKVVITGNIGPNAYQVLSAAGVTIITGAAGTVREAVERYKRGELRPTLGLTVPAHFGAGWGMGLGRGMKGRWRMRPSPPAPQAPTPLQAPPPPRAPAARKPEEELAALQEYKKRLEEDLESIKARIKELKSSTKPNSQKK
ncbi:TPA: hypothetical protein EYP26_01860 [Candidatus Bathyarchaeota archaeon]|nr:hypothetical protein [Candidatus Bathyarchaeota archaeon]